MNSITTGVFENAIRWMTVTNNIGTIGIMLKADIEPTVYAPISATAMVIHSD